MKPPLFFHVVPCNRHWNAVVCHTDRLSMVKFLPLLSHLPTTQSLMPGDNNGTCCNPIRLLSTGNLGATPDGVSERQIGITGKFAIAFEATNASPVSCIALTATADQETDDSQ